MVLTDGPAKFMYYMRRLANRDLTMYCSGPFLLHACLDQFYLKKNKNPITVQQLCDYVKVTPKGSKEHARKKAPIEMIKVPGTTTPVVNFEYQNQRIFKIQRGSWDVSGIAGYF